MIPRLFIATFLLLLSTSFAHADLPTAALPGDYPDPSVIRVGKDYWATATSGDWAPEFPIFHSRDLVHWEITGAVFKKRPAWAQGDFWAPELFERNNQYFVYYAARNQNGVLCVAVATSDRPDGTYLDHGPLVCDSVGSIDPAPVVDEKGNLYLVWKRDGNSQNQPTPIVAQPLSSDGLKLQGQPTELIRNDAAWEGQVVEAPYILRHNGYFYLFYAGASCCSLQCDYAEGVARSQKLLGPWEKNPLNPILASNDSWKCPGHGSIASDLSGKDFLLYHAMNAKDSIYVGRQPMVDFITWDSDGWPSINNGKGPENSPSSKLTVFQKDAEKTFIDYFTAPELLPSWEWPQDNEPVYQLENRRGQHSITLATRGRPKMDFAQSLIAHSTTTATYRAETEIDLSSVSDGASAGLAAYGSPTAILGLSVSKQMLTLWGRNGSDQKTFDSAPLPASAKQVLLRVSVTNATSFAFAFSVDGKKWTQLGSPLDGAYLPPWDLGIRMALIKGGLQKNPARFNWFKILPQDF